MDELLNELLYPVSQHLCGGGVNQSNVGGVSHSQAQVYNKVIIRQ